MNDRAVSEVISYVLIFSLIVSAVGVVSVSGIGSLQSARDAEQLENSERAFDVLSDNIDDITVRGAPTRATEIQLDRSRLFVGPEINIQVQLYDGGTPGPSDNWDIRPLVLEGTRDRQLVYEAGATFRSNPDSTVLVDDPQFVFRSSPGSSDRVLVPIVDLETDGVQGMSGSTILVRAEEKNRRIVEADQGTYEQVELTITSPRWEAWETYLLKNGFTGCTQPGAGQIRCTYNGNGASDAIEHLIIVRYDISIDLQS